MNYCRQEKHHWNLAKKQLLVKGSNCSEANCCLHSPSTAMGGRSHRALGSMEAACETSGDKKVAHGTPRSLWFAAHHLCWLALTQNSPGTHKHTTWAATKNTLLIAKKIQLPLHKTRGQAMWNLFLKGNIRGQKILPRQTRKSCIRTGLITWKVNLDRGRTTGRLTKQIIIVTKQHGFCTGKSCLWWALSEFLKYVKLPVRNTGRCN